MMRTLTPTLAVLALVACGGDKDSDSSTTATGTGTGTATATATGTGTGTGTATGTATGTGTGTGMTSANATVRVVHASPDAPAVDVYANGDTTPLWTNVAWGDTSASLDIPEGTYTIELRGAGADPSSAPAYAADLSVSGDMAYTVVASGLFGSTDAATEFRLLPFVDDFDAAGAGEAMVRIVHASATAPTVDIDVGDDGTVEIPSLMTFGDTAASGVPLPSGSELQVAIWAGGMRVTGFTTPALAEGSTYYVIATGLLERLPREDDGFSLLAVDENGSVGFIKQNPEIYALHASPDAPAVDVFTGGAELIDNLDYGVFAGPLQVPPGAYDLDFYGHTAGQAPPAGAPAASAMTPDLMAGERYIAVATGFLSSGAPAFQLLPLQDGFDLTDTNARLQVVHASPDAPNVDIGTYSGATLTPVWTDVPFGVASADVGDSLPAATYDIGIGIAGSGTPLFEFPGVALGSGDRVVAIAMGSVAGGTFQLKVVDTTASPWAAVDVFPAP